MCCFCNQLSNSFLTLLCLLGSSCTFPKGEILALDCEMVGIGKTKKSALARCSIVDYHGNIQLDCYVKPKSRITDYRTRYSGIFPHHMKNAIPFHRAKKKVKRLLKGKHLVGHAIASDLKILQLEHDPEKIRDTSQFVPLRMMAGLPVSKLPSLRNLSIALFNKEIQKRVHCSVEDSRMAMQLYRLVEDKWELNFPTDDCYLDDMFWPDFVKL